MQICKGELKMVNLPQHVLIHSVFCLTTGSKPPPKRCLHILRSRASSFKWEYPLLSLKSSSSFLRLLHRFPFTSFSPFIFPSITCFRRQFLRKMWPIQLAFRFLISCRIFLCSLRHAVIKVENIKNVVCFLLVDSPSSEIYMPTFRNTLSVPSS